MSMFAAGILEPLPVLLILLAGQVAGATIEPTTFKNEKGEFFQRPGVRVSEILRARGYLAEEHQFVSDDGYVLGLTRGLNPLVSRKRSLSLGRQPILFVHGTLTDGNSFVTNSFEVESAQDWSHVDADKLSEQQLEERFAGEPAAKSLAFLAMNFGHEIWFLHRRGSQMSQKRLDVRNKSPTVMEKYLRAARYTERLRGRGARRTKRSQGAGGADRGHERVVAALERTRFGGLPLLNEPAGKERPAADKKSEKTTKSGSKLLEALKATPGAFFHGHLLRDIQVTFDRRQWNHSLDEQAAYDLPRAVDFVLEASGFERLALVGDSSGGALIMMSLILEPSLNHKLSKAIAWVPSFHIGHTKNEGSFAPAQPIFRYIGPYPLAFVSLPFQAFLELACSLEIMQKTLCALAVDAGWGPSEGKQIYRSEFGAGYMTPVSAHEYLHLIQFHTRQATRMFDFNDVDQNMRAYGQPDTPRYNASLINFEYLSIYVGTSDSLVTERDIATVHQEMRVPHRIVTMRGKGANHGAVLFHDQVATMVMIPTYKDIVSHGYRSGGQGERNRLSGEKENHTHEEREEFNEV